MTTVALSGNDTLTINNYLLTGQADGNVVELTFPNEIMNVKTGKNGNSIYGFNTTGQQCEVKCRVVRGFSRRQIPEWTSYVAEFKPSRILFNDRRVH